MMEWREGKVSECKNVSSNPGIRAGEHLVGIDMLRGKWNNGLETLVSRAF